MKNQDDTRSHSDHDAASPDNEIDTTAEDEVQSILSSMNQVPKFSDTWFKLKEKEISLRNGLTDDFDEDVDAADKVGLDGGNDVTKTASKSNANVGKSDLQSVANTKPFIGTMIETIADEAAPVPSSSAQVKVIKNNIETTRPEQMPLPRDAPMPFGMTDVDGGDVKKIGRSGLEAMPSEKACDAPMPFDMADVDGEDGKQIKRSGLEVMPSEDACAPTPVGLDTHDEEIKEKILGSTLEQVSDDSVPMPSTFYEPIDENLGTKMSASTISSPRTGSSNIDIENTSPGAEEDLMHCGYDTQLSPRQVEFLDTVHSRDPDNTSREVNAVVETQREAQGGSHHLEGPANELTAGFQNGIDSMSSSMEGAVNVGQPELPRHGNDVKLPEIPEAYLVDDETVIIATNPTPWWKQRRTKILFAVVLVLVVAVLAATLRITLTPERTVTQMVAITASPTISAVPSLQPTLVPSSSQVPSSSPSACSYRVINSTRQIQLYSTSQTNLKTAFDGHNLVVAWKQFFAEFNDENDDETFFNEGAFYIAFYSLSDDNQWTSSGYHIEEKVNFDTYSPWIDNDFDLDISGKTAVIGLPVIDTVYVFMQNDSGLWIQVSSPQPTDCGNCCPSLGVFVYICDDLLAVADSSQRGLELGPSAAYFFEHQGSEWKQIGVENNPDCSFVSQIPAILARNGTQYPRCPKRSAYATQEENGLNIYQWDESKNVSIVTQIFNSSDYGDGFGQAFAVVDDLLVVGSSSYTHIFAEIEDQWEEVLTLDKSYDSYALSGHTLVAVKDNEVYSMSIADCTPELKIPTQSSLDTTCYEVVVSTRFSYKEASPLILTLWDDDQLVLSYSDDPETIIECTESTSAFMVPWSVTILQSDFLMSDSSVASSTSGCDCGFTDSMTCLYPGWYKAIYQRYKGLGKYPYEAICHNITFVFHNSSESGFNLTKCLDIYGTIEEVIEFDVPLTTMRWMNPTSSPTSYPTITSSSTKTISPT